MIFFLMLAAFCAAQPKFGVGLDDEIPIYPPFEEPPKLWDQDETLPIELQVIEVTDQIYDDQITMRLLGINRASTPWVIVFVDPKHVDSKRAMAQYKYLAKHYNGTVRFGYVNRRKELLAATFGVTMTPATFLIKEGKVYQYRDFTYADKLAKYINEEGYHNSTNKFSQPGRYFKVQLYLYTYPVKHLRSWYRVNLEPKVNQLFRDYKMNKYIVKSTQAADIIYKTMFTLSLLIVFVILRVCCKKKVVYEKSSSLDDVKKTQ